MGKKPMSMSQALVIVHVDGDHRIDSRILAKELGYDHKVILQSIRRHKARLEAKSALLQFEATLKHTGYQGATRQTYYMLNERQCLILTGSLKKGTEAEEWHDTLVDAFLQARVQVKELQAHEKALSVPVNMLWQQRLALFNEQTHIPIGYWCIFNEIAATCWRLEFLGAHLREDAVPDISIGQHWCKYARSIGLDMSLIRKYPHHYPDHRRVVAANIYPDIWLPPFRRWFQGNYLKNEFPRYMQAHALTLPATTTRRLLG